MVGKEEVEQRQVDTTLKQARAIAELIFERTGLDLSVAEIARLSIQEKLERELQLVSERVSVRSPGYPG